LQVKPAANRPTAVQPPLDLYSENFAVNLKKEWGEL
jgi:hypothetical protein